MSWTTLITDSLSTLALSVGSTFFNTLATVATPVPGVDEHPRLYWFQDVCTYTPNGNTVVAVTVGPATGCWIQTYAFQVNADWNATGGLGLIANKPTTLSGYGITDAYPLSGNPAGFLTSINSSAVTTALGYTPYNATNPASYITQAGARGAINLTTTGSSGAATYNSTTGTLNVPNYAPGSGTVTSVTAGTGLSGGTFTTSGTISMPNVGTAGTYNLVTTDAQGRVTSGTNSAFTVGAPNTRSISLATAYQCTDNTKPCTFTLTMQCPLNSLLTGSSTCAGEVRIGSANTVASGASGTVIGPINRSVTGVSTLLAFSNGDYETKTIRLPTGWYIAVRQTNSQGGTLTVPGAFDQSESN